MGLQIGVRLKHLPANLTARGERTSGVLDQYVSTQLFLGGKVRAAELTPDRSRAHRTANGPSEITLRFARRGFPGARRSGRNPGPTFRPAVSHPGAGVGLRPARCAGARVGVTQASRLQRTPGCTPAGARFTPIQTAVPHEFMRPPGSSVGGSSTVRGPGLDLLGGGRRTAQQWPRPTTCSQ